MDPFYRLWHIIYLFSHSNLDIMFDVTRTVTGEPMVVLYDEYDNLVPIDNEIKHRIVVGSLQEYLAYVKENGRPATPSGVAWFYPYQIATVIRKRIAGDQLNDVELKIFAPVFNPDKVVVKVPFTMEDCADASVLVDKLLDVVPQISEDTGFWIGVKMFSYDRVNGRWDRLDKPIFRISVDCSDFFMWATADSEEITLGQVSLYKKAITDVLNAYHSLPVEEQIDEEHYPFFIYGLIGKLFCARVRGITPGVYQLHKYPTAISDLF